MLLSTALVGCGGGGSSDGAAPNSAGADTAAVSLEASESTTAETADSSTSTSEESTAATEPAAPETIPAADSVPASEAAASLNPLDDLDEDGEADALCGTADLGGGLIVQPLCDTSLQPSPEDGVRPTVGSLLLLPAPPRWTDLADVDATVRVARTVDGRRVAIYVLGSDTLFDSGSASIRSTAQPPLTAIIASITDRYPQAPIEVRGAADSVGSREANQQLSEQRARAVADTLAALGLDAGRITSRGLGADAPVAEETSDDGSVSELGRQVNRRVEIVVG